MSGRYTYNYPNTTLTRDLDGAQELCEKLEDYGYEIKLNLTTGFFDIYADDMMIGGASNLWEIEQSEFVQGILSDDEDEEDEEEEEAND